MVGKRTGLARGLSRRCGAIGSEVLGVRSSGDQDRHLGRTRALVHVGVQFDGRQMDPSHSELHFSIPGGLEVSNPGASSQGSL
jgi:hypothetical protein